MICFTWVLQDLGYRGLVIFIKNMSNYEDPFLVQGKLNGAISNSTILMVQMYILCLFDQKMCQTAIASLFNADNAWIISVWYRYRWLLFVRFKYKPGYKINHVTCYKFKCSQIGWDILSSLNAVISTNERNQIYKRSRGL